MILEDQETAEYKKLIIVLKTKFNYSFENYALESFKRRVNRILFINKLDSITKLIEKLLLEKDFAEVVVKEITVNTTEMFRDPSFWRKLKTDIIPLIAKNEKIRIWHAACSSGEEVYSMAIVLKELDLLDRCSIIATDINDLVLEKAKQGIYSKKNMENNDSNYQRFTESTNSLSKYYSNHSPDFIKMNPELIKNITFKKHDLTTNVGISKYDLILCRNVMIYFNYNLQNSILKLFAESLFVKSYLAIGSKETIAWCDAAKLYVTFNAEEKIYQKIG